MSEPASLPMWIAAEIGNLYLQNVALRQALDETQRKEMLISQTENDKDI